jgi:chaperonin GroES
MNLRPLGDKIMIKRLDAATRTDSGIFLPESATEKPQEAKVLAVGQGRLTDSGKRVDFQVKKGDVVVISKWGGSEIKLGSDEVIIVTEEDILGIVDA